MLLLLLLLLALAILRLLVSKLAKRLLWLRKEPPVVLVVSCRLLRLLADVEKATEASGDHKRRMNNNMHLYFV
jgi:hypothetical protein